MAPEQARGEAVDGRTDVYALGLLAYTMLCGVQLFEDEGSAIEILAAHITRPPVPPRERVPDLPAALDALILEMIAKPPDQRPALDEIRRRLAAIAADADRSAPPAMLAADRPAPPVMAGAPTLPASIAGPPASRPPTLPGADAPPRNHPPTMPGANRPPDRPSAMLGSGPVGGAHDSEIAVAPRRSWWAIALAAVVAIAAAGAAMFLRGSSAPVAAGPREARAVQAPGAAARPAVPGESDLRPSTAPSPPAAADPPAPAAPAPAAPPGRGAPSAAPITAELAVEPRGAQLSVDGQPVPLVAGRAALALPPGDHEALASAAGRVTRQRFTVTAGRAARVALRVPAAPAPATPRPASPGGDDVDGVEDPFRK